MNIELFDGEESKAVAKVDQNQQDSLLEKLLLSGQMDVIDRYMALKERAEERLAKSLFDENFSKMQAEFKPVEKTKEVKNRAGEHMYFYAPIEDLVKTNGKAITDHGFSWRFESESVKDGEVRSVCIVSGFGHDRRSYFDTPVAPATPFCDAAKQRAIAATFGQRYAFKGATGMTIYGEDSETPEDVSVSEDKIRPMLEEMSAQTTAKDLMAVYIKHFNSLKNDKPGQSRLISVKNDLIKQFPEVKQ